MSTLTSLKRLSWSVVLPLTLTAVAPSSQAFEGPGSVTVSNGKSTLTFSPQFFNLFPALGATLGGYGKANFQGSLNKQNQRITFPIASGTLNPNRPPSMPFYAFEHQGGLTMNRDDGTLDVIFNNPSLRASSDCLTPSSQCLELGATLIVNGTVYLYVSNFAQSANLSGFQLKGNDVKIDNVPLFLTQAGANAMNAFFNLNQGGDIYFQKWYEFGVLNVKGTGYKVVCPPNTDYNKNRQECR
jgi:hypothetical protein